jgi:hypothetical protein
MIQIAALSLLATPLVAPTLALRRSHRWRAVALALLPAAAMSVSFALSLATGWGDRADQKGGDITNAGDLFILAVLLLVAGVLGLGFAGLLRIVFHRRERRHAISGRGGPS